MARTRKSSWTNYWEALWPPLPPDNTHYYYVSQRPWPSLLFILPMLLIFELGTYYEQGGPPTGGSQLVATYLIDALVNCFGRSAFYLPGLFTVVILLASHIAARHTWRFDPFVLAGMIGESLVYTVPLLVFDGILHTAMRSGLDPTRHAWLMDIFRSFGAGIYEELVFRLICINLLAMLLVNLCRLPRSASVVLIVLISSGLFAAHHHPPLGVEPFEPARFVFRTAAGAYLAGIFLYRGFGIACGAHAFYNVIVVTIKAI